MFQTNTDHSSFLSSTGTGIDCLRSVQTRQVMSAMEIHRIHSIQIANGQTRSKRILSTTTRFLFNVTHYI